MNAHSSEGYDQDPGARGDIERQVLYMDATELRRDAYSSFGIYVTLLTYAKVHSYQIMVIPP